MTKKDYLLKLLGALENDRQIAPGLKILIEASVLDEKTMAALFDIFRNAVNAMVSEDEKAKLERGLDFLEKLQASELISNKSDEKAIQELDTMLENIYTTPL